VSVRSDATRAPRVKRSGPESTMMAVVFGLVCFSVVMVYSATSAQAVLAGTNPFGFAEKQLLYALLGGAAFLFCHRWDPKFLQRIAGIGMVASVIVLIAVLLPGVGVNVNGARRWMAVPVFGQVQPAEFAKLTLVLWIAAAIARNPRAVGTLRGVVPYLAVTFAMAGLILFEPDLGTATTLAFVGLAMLLVAGARPGHIGLALGVGAALAAIAIAAAPYRRARLLAFLDPWHQATTNGFQTVQAQIAVGSGGIHGVGLGGGLQKAFYLPEAHSDMILASIGEELGFIGITAVLMAIAAVVLLAFRIAIRAPDLHQRLIATGLATLIAVQGLSNAGAALGVMPVTGVPLPFVSYGGSSLIVLLASTGVLFSISRRTQRATRSQRTTDASTDRSQRDGRARDARARRRGSAA
jgi:cell division protein FtsW